MLPSVPVARKLGAQGFRGLRPDLRSFVRIGEDASQEHEMPWSEVREHEAVHRGLAKLGGSR